MKTTNEYFVVYEALGKKQTSYPFADLWRAENLAQALSNQYHCQTTIIEHTTFSA